MKIVKVRGEQADFYNEIVGGMTLEMFVGYDNNGKELYEGDIVTDLESGEDYRVVIKPVLERIAEHENLSNFILKE